MMHPDWEWLGEGSSSSSCRCAARWTATSCFAIRKVKNVRLLEAKQSESWQSRLGFLVSCLLWSFRRVRDRDTPSTREGFESATDHRSRPAPSPRQRDLSRASPARL